MYPYLNLKQSYYNSFGLCIVSVQSAGAGVEGNEVQTTVAVYLLFNFRTGLVTKQGNHGSVQWTLVPF